MLGRNVPVQRASLMAAVILGFMLSCVTCRATTFDWPTSPAWSATGPASGATETVDYGYYANGSTRVSVFNSGMTWQTTAPGYPSVAAGGGGIVNGGLAVNGLMLFATASASNSSYAQVTIYFQYTGGANNISFNLWDVDSSSPQFTDKISNIVGTTLAGATVQATTITPTATFNQLNGTVGTAGVNVTGIANATNTTNQGNVTIGFTQTVSSITFQWSNAASGLGAQAIGISPITFTSIGTAFPEVNSSSAALMLCGGVMGFGLIRRRRNADRSQCQSHT